ncbi:MAG: cryptochrome/photolyase family protein, partial [Haliscomenobacter sp.]
MSKSIFLVFPHQLFEQLPLSTTGVHRVAIVEEHLFFTQYAFHKQKLRFHRASMSWYADYLKESGYGVEYYACRGAELHIASLVSGWKEAGVDALHVYRVEDDWLTQRLESASRAVGLALLWYDTPQFILNRAAVAHYFSGKSQFLQGNFYAAQRKRLHILMDGSKPVGGRWSFDEENRLRYPAGKRAPALPGGHSARESVYWEEAGTYVQQHFSACPGQVEGAFAYPISHTGAAQWLQQFLDDRLAEFGRYEDAIVWSEPLLGHSLLSVLLNAGLLLPSTVLERVLEHAQRHAIPLNETEGFVRQLLGWREFVRGVYLHVGREQRTHNFWNFERPMPASFYTGCTGIPILDQVIRKVQRNGYCHHIERLMVLSNFMLLCEIHP